MRAKLAGDVFVGAVKVRVAEELVGEVTVEDFRWQPRDGAATPFLVAMRACTSSSTR